MFSQLKHLCKTTFKKHLVATFLFIQVILLTSGFVTSQESGSDILIISDASITMLDISTGIESTRFEFSPTPSLSTPAINALTYRILDAEFDRHTNLLYVVRGQLPDGDETPHITRVEEIDMTTGITSVVYEQRVVTDIALSPDGSLALLNYYDGDIVWSGETHICVLEIKIGICTPVDFKADGRAHSFSWIDNQTFIAFSWSPRTPYIFDVNSLKGTLLSGLETWQIDLAVPIPLTRSLMVAGLHRDSGSNTIQSPDLMIYDLDTNLLTDYALQLSAPKYLQPYVLKFSPNGDHFVIGGFQASSVVAFDTGELVTELTNVIETSWSSDSRHLLATVSLPDKLQVLDLDMHLKNQTTLLTEKAYRILVAL